MNHSALSRSRRSMPGFRLNGKQILVAMAMLAALGRASAQSTSVTTYHNDNARTGANQTETILTPGNVTAGSFGAITTVPLDDFSNTQPLVVNDAAIHSFAPNGVVYVGTDSNTIYAVDAANGTILKQRNLGAPVPSTWSCTGPNLGIFGTPTIDLTSRTLYVMANTLVNGQPVFQLHALDLQTLAEAPNSPVTVQATKILQDGTTYTFDANAQRQRPAMLESNGAIYVAFGSQCDLDQGVSRGWVLGWDAATLAPLSGAEVTNLRGASASGACWGPLVAPCYLSAIWMSGYGPAADASGSIYFVTGNSADSSYDPVFNLAESAVKISSDLSQTLDFFTPNNQPALDDADTDYGSGGIMLLPDQGGQFPPLAVAAGKDGRMFVFNRNSMGGLNNPDVPNNVQVGKCWCGPSYLQTANGGFVVTSGGKNVELWSPTLSGGLPTLSLTATAPAIEANTQSPGFFTSVSSNGNAPNTGIIWALGRAAGTDLHITLYAYSATPSGGTLPLLWSGVAGQWPAIPKRHNINAVPTIANGYVYVTSYQQLQIFGLVTGSTATSTAVTANPATIASSGSTTLTATVTATSGSATPTGNVTFTTGTTSLGSATLTGSGLSATAAVTVNGSVFPLSSNTVTATYTPLGSFTPSTGTASVNVTSGAAAVIFSTMPPPTGTAGTPFGAVVQLRDSTGNLVTTSGVLVTIGTTSSGISGTLTGNTVNGVATFTNLIFGAPGSYRLTAASPGLTGAVSHSIVISAAVATQLAFRAQPPATGTPGVAVNASVQIQDANGNPVNSSAAVTIGSSPAGVGGTLTVNAITGVASFSNLVFNSPGSYALTASSPGATGATSNTIVVQAASQTITFNQPANVTFGVAPFQLVATASSGLAVTLTSNTPSVCTVSAAKILTVVTAGSCSITATQPGDAVNPAATPVTQSFTIAKATPVVTWAQPGAITVGTALGAAQLNATANVQGTFVYAPPAGTQLPVGAGQALSVTFTPADSTDYTTASAATTITVNQIITGTLLAFLTQPPATGTAGVPFGAAVQLEDSTGKPVTASGVPVTIGTTSSGISGTLTVNTVNGVATFTNLIFTAPASYRLTASSPGYTGAVSHSITIAAAAVATQLVFRGQPPATGVTGTPFYSSVQIRDANGTPVSSSAQVTIASSPAGVAGTVVVNAVTGVAVFNNLVFNSPGSYVLTASSPGLTGATSTTIVVSASAP